MSREWLERKERGSPFLIRLIARVALSAGRSVARVLLYPITAYFLLFMPRARRASRDYLTRVLERPVRLRDLFRHFHYFAAIVLDRVYLLSERWENFEIELSGPELLLEQVRQGRGCVLLGSHLGSFEVLRCLAETIPDLRVRPLMYKANAERTNRVLNALNPRIGSQVIAIGEPDSLFQVQEALGRGEMVGILGDRLTREDKSVVCTFLGSPAHFPAGPLLIAGLLEVPVLLFFGLYQGGRRYRIHLESLTSGFHLERDTRQQQLTEWTQAYVDRLEHYCREAPFNWFNFFDFWDEAKIGTDS